MKKKLMLLLALTAIRLHGGAYSRPQGRYTDTRASSSSNRRIANTTPGRRSQGFSNNPRLNWRHPYGNR